MPRRSGASSLVPVCAVLMSWCWCHAHAASGGVKIRETVARKKWGVRPCRALPARLLTGPRKHACSLYGKKGWAAVQRMQPRLQSSWDVRLGRRRCFRQAGMERFEAKSCCDSKYGVDGDQRCFAWGGHLAEAPWYHLCCGKERSSSLVSALALQAPAKLPEHFEAPWPSNEACFPYGQRCAFFIINYEKTGNQVIGNKVLPLLAPILMPRIYTGALETARHIWRRNGQRLISPIGGIGVDYESVWTSDAIVNGSTMSVHHGRMLVHIGELIPQVRSLRAQDVEEDVWRPLAGASVPSSRVVHFIRSPVDTVASSFRNAALLRLAEARAAGKPLLGANASSRYLGLNCHGCDHPSWHYIFRFCDYSCSYEELLLKATQRSWPTGLRLEYARLRRSMQNMLANAATWKQHGTVLHLSPDQMRADPVATTLCLVRFMTGSLQEKPAEKGGRESPSSSSATWVVPEDILTKVAEALQAAVESGQWSSLKRHITSGDSRWEQYKLEERLFRHTKWGRALLDADLWVWQLLKAQAKLYGCPDPRRAYAN